MINGMNIGYLIAIGVFFGVPLLIIKDYATDVIFKVYVDSIIYSIMGGKK